MKKSLIEIIGRANGGLFRGLALWLLLLAGLGLSAQAQTFSYAAQQPLPVFGSGGAAYGNGVYVNVSGGGYIYRSLDGKNWSVATNTAFINTNYTSVCFAQGLFVACAASGAIATSSNGVNWYRQNSGTTRYTYDSVYLNGRYFVTCNGGIILSSTDATNWVSQTVAASSYGFFSLTYGDGKYLMSAYNQPLGGNASYYIYTSTTGTSGWTASQISGESGSNYNFIGYLNNKFYVFLSSAHIYTSPDGSTWTRFTTAPIASTGYQIMGGTYINGNYYFFGFDSQTYGAIFTSTNGTNFVELPKGFSDQVGELIYANGIFVANNNSSFAFSTNATNWVSVAGSYYGVAYNGTNYVAVGSSGNSGDGYIAVSPDFVNWTNVTPGWTPNYYGVTYGNGKFVAVSYAMTGFANGDSVIATSGDGINWSLHTNTVAYENFYAVATDGRGTFVAVGDNGDTLRSTDNAVTWTVINASTGGNALNGVRYVNSQFVAVGFGGNVVYSTDGSSWTHADYSDTDSWLTDIAYGNGRYVMTGSDGNYNNLCLTRSSLTSGSWAVPSSPPPAIPANSYAWPVLYANGVFLTSYDDTNYNGYLFTSTNGQTWTQHNLGVTNVFSPQIFGGVYANGAFQLVGLYDYTATATVTLAQPPGITSPNTAAAAYGSSFSYTIAASNSPMSYGAAGLPSGLSVNTSSGFISGRPTQSGTYAATIGATNGAGAAAGALTITVAKAGATISGLVANNKVFDGTTTATLNFSGATVNGVVNSDSISVNNTGYTANFSTTNVANNLAVTISGLTLAGVEATNYLLTPPGGFTADITPASAVVVLNTSVQLYNGSAKSVTATTIPTGLPVGLTYNGSSTAPSSAGAYTVIGTVTNPNYAGSATNFLYVATAPEILSVHTNDNLIIFTWSALPPVNYQVVSTSNLLTSWNNFNGVVSATNAVMTTTDVINPNQQANFYRVKLILE